MTTPKIRTVKRGGSRFYVHPDKTFGQVPGVTSVVGQLPKEFLKFWTAKLTAETAVDNIGAVVQMVTNGDRDGAIDYLKRAHFRNTAKAADMGSEAHEVFEKMSLGEPIGRQHPDMEPFVRGFQAFLDQVEPEFLHIEETVWSTDPGYAGSFDSIVRIAGEKLDQEEDAIVILDNKTTRSGVHADVALQLNAYANADFILNKDGSTTPLPDINAAAVVHVRPEGWQLVPVRLGDDIFELFCSLIPVVSWEREVKPTALADAIAGDQWEES